MTMIPDAFEYEAPGSLAEAVAVLADSPTNQAIAGGNGLLTELKRGELHVARLVDLRQLDELRGMSVNDDGRLRVGALTTLTELLNDQTVRAAHIPGALSDALEVAGDVQTRNRATVGGTVASAAQGSDLLAALLVLEATVEIAGPDGKRVTPIGCLLDGSDGLRTGELITAVELAPAEPGSAYLRQANKATLHAVTGVAVTVALAGDGTVASCRVAVTGALPTTQRLSEVEDRLAGGGLPVALGNDPLGPSFVDDRMASAVYREHLTKVLAERAFAVAVQRAQAV
jgi:carbon-monoxide dehydrogenase medium subunit